MPVYSPRLDCWYLTGPTAGGKTAVGLALAEQIGAEIASLDSMALYRGMDVGTAKPSADQRQRVPHHLIDLVDPWQVFSVAQYVEAAHRAADAIHARGKIALFVGGTPLYLKAMLRGLATGPTADWDTRHRLAEEARRFGPHVLHDRLAEVDPVAASRLHVNDVRRVIRAIEFYEQMGTPLSASQQQFDVAPSPDECHAWVLEWSVDELNRRIDARVDAMFAAGLVDEVRRLLAAEKPLSRTAVQALGYREVAEHLAGKRDLDATRELVKTLTRRFAKRQRTWFRALPECRPLAAAEPLDPVATADRIAAAERHPDTRHSER
ncbi:MAG: tRNA (adenosine(37)-N6)-dimethylallyltransferase MiaA [Pirellulales bacterium]